MSYRIEISPNARAMCQQKQCKDENVKIKKGELRQAVMVMFQEHQSWKYRHWGCVTPEVLHNWREVATSGGEEIDEDMIDGYDTLPPEAQQKVKRALEQEHVDDEDWNGDIEMNRWTGKPKQGMFVKTPKKKAKGDGDDDGETPAKKTTKKRGRAKDDDGDEAATEEKPAKKSKAKKSAKAEDEDGEDEAPPPKKSRKAKVKSEDAEEDEAPKPAAKKGKKSKAAAKSEPVADAEPEDENETPAPAKKTKSKKAAKTEAADGDEVKPKPQKRKAKGKKADAGDEE